MPRGIKQDTSHVQNFAHETELPKHTIDSLKFLAETVKAKSEMENKTRTQIAKTIGLGSGEQWRKLDKLKNSLHFC